MAAVPRRLVRDVRVRAVTLWAGLRLGLFALAPFIGAPTAGPAAFIWVELLAIGLVQSDVKVCRETVFLANLGVSRLQLFRLTLPAVIAPEIVVQLLLRLLVFA